ncbi:MAG: translation initiation factor IF-2 [Clostridia bacterium]|nr:translation initiation factor IF-2 [Clostridia bacterium]
MADTETKVVKAQSKKNANTQDHNASKVQIRAVDKAIIEAQQAKRTKSAAASARPAKPAETARPLTPPPGKPVPRTPSAGKAFPFGKPMPKNAVPQKKADVPQNVEKKEEDKPVEPVVQMPETIETKSPEKAAPPVSETVKPEKKEPEMYMDPPIGVKIIKKAEPAETPEKAEETKAETPAEETAPKKETAEKPEAEEKAPKAAEEEPASKKPAAEEKKTEAPAKPAKEEKKEAPKKEEPKKDEPKKEEQKIDYVPNIGVKIIRRAADEPKPEPKPARTAQSKGKKDDKAKANADRKPKEYKGKQGGKPETSSPRKKDFGGKKTNEGGREKVVAYTAPAGGDTRRRNKKDKDVRDKFEEQLTDLTKSAKKKHSKYKEKVEEVQESAAEIEAQATGGVIIDVPITVGGFCEQLEVSMSDAIMALMKMGIMANINQNLDEETAVLLGMELGKTVVINKAEEITEEEGLDLHEDAESELMPRPPIITVMGHVDHGKTSLLDAIRNTNVTAGEAGGITQHIGASEIEINGQKIVFLDTPGHEAFTAMRARGAHVTDIAVLVVAADDGVMPQTIESISHAKAAGVPIIVAINKMDKPGANPDRVKKELADQSVLVEDWGGSTISVPVSAKTGEGIKNLLEMILLQAEMLELRANPDRLAMGTVIEARLDKARGPVATLLVTNGTLQAGQALVVGTASGRVRVMTDWKGNQIRKAGPSRAVEITGLTEVPEAGDEFYAVREERIARDIAARRKEKLREETLAKNSSTSLEQLFATLQEGEVRDLNLIIKADVQGSVGALEASLEKLHNENVRVKIIHTGVGTITESDVMLASTSDAVIIGFNVRPSSAVQAMADQDGVEIRTYRIIYEIIDDIEAAMKGMLEPVFKEVILGKVEVRNTFKVPGVGTVAGAYVMEGKVTRNAKVRLVRDGIVVHEGVISSLKRFKDDAKEVASGYECGIGIEKYNDIKEGDIIEAFVMQEVER